MHGGCDYVSEADNGQKRQGNSTIRNGIESTILRPGCAPLNDQARICEADRIRQLQGLSRGETQRAKSTAVQS